MKILILRHAERNSMPSEQGLEIAGFNEDLVPINSEGAQAAISLGDSLAGEFKYIYHSPILRCQQTAIALSEKSRMKIEGPLNYLSSKYFIELDDCDEKKKQMLVDGMLTGKINQKFTAHHYNSLLERMNFVLRRFEQANDGSVFVTHDWWMALFLSWHTNIFEYHGYSIWPKFLEYFVIDYERNIIAYRDQQFKLPQPLQA
jgi:broad specificity phosphatase PhoE